MKKIVSVSAFLLLSLIFLTGCTKISLTGSVTGTPPDGQMGTPPDGGIPPEGGIPPAGGTPSPEAPDGAPVNN